MPLKTTPFCLTRTISIIAIAGAFLFFFGFQSPSSATESKKKFQMIDVFELEYVSDPQISSDGRRIVYARNFMDIMKDLRRSNLSIVNRDGSDHEIATRPSQLIAKVAHILAWFDKYRVKPGA